jgi:hypothetical protein
MGFRSPIVLDDGFAVSRAFGAEGTPSAALVDAAGKIASPVAVARRPCSPAPHPWRLLPRRGPPGLEPNDIAAASDRPDGVAARCSR